MNEDATETSKVTAAIEIRGTAANVLQQATRLLEHVTQDLRDATLVSLRVEYDPASAPSHVPDPHHRDPIEMAGWDVSSPAESRLWELALRIWDRPAATAAPDEERGCAPS